LRSHVESLAHDADPADGQECRIDRRKELADLPEHLLVESRVTGDVKRDRVALQHVAVLENAVSRGDRGYDHAADLRAVPLLELHDVLVAHRPDLRAEAVWHDYAD